MYQIIDYSVDIYQMFSTKKKLNKTIKKFYKTDKIIYNTIYSNASHPKQTKKALKIKK